MSSTKSIAEAMFVIAIILGVIVLATAMIRSERSYSAEYCNPQGECIYETGTTYGDTCPLYFDPIVGQTLKLKPSTCKME